MTYLVIPKNVIVCWKYRSISDNQKKVLRHWTPGWSTPVISWSERSRNSRLILRKT